MPEPLNFHVIGRKSTGGSTSDFETGDRNSQLAQQSSPTRIRSSESHLTPLQAPRRGSAQTPEPSPSRTSETRRMSSQLQQVSMQ